ncbi:MAG: hypothetical protein GX458_09900 [Phyllobacteriaceae bacterium]|nr:hypothetical protein [Phyllobacteriaceae bacterium]
MGYEKRRRMLASAAILGIVAATPASASATTPVKVGGWTVYDGVDGKNPAACAAVLPMGGAFRNGGNNELRLLSDGRAWYVGTDYNGPKKKLEVYYGFGDAAEVATFTWDGSSWLMLRLDKDQLDAFRGNPEFAITLGGAEGRWKLAGAGAAIDKVAQCSRDRGLKSAAAAPPPPPPSGVVGKGCPAPGSVRSVEGKRPVKVMFVNMTKAPLDIHWIGYQGERKKYQRVAPNSNVEQRTFATHPWIAVDPRGNCHGGVMRGDPNDRSEGANMFQIWD